MGRACLTIVILLSACGPETAQPPRKDQRPDQPQYPLDTLPWPTDGWHPLDGPRVDRVADRPGSVDAKPHLDAHHDGTPPPTAKCGGTAKLLLAEVATGQPDYLALFNNGTSPISLSGFRLEMMGIGLVSYAFKSETIAAGKTLYVFEYATGQAGDVNTGDNLPFYDSLDANSVALWDGGGNLLDFVAIGDSVVRLPQGATAAAVPWPAAFNPKTHSFQRVAQAGACPTFKSSDWAAKPITRP